MEDRSKKMEVRSKKAEDRNGRWKIEN